VVAVAARLAASELCSRVPALFLVDDLDALVPEIASRGIELDERETYSNRTRRAIYRDGDGDEIGFGGVPASVASPWSARTGGARFEADERLPQ